MKDMYGGFYEQEELEMNKLICGKEMCSLQDTTKKKGPDLKMTKKTTINKETFSKGGTSPAI